MPQIPKDSRGRITERAIKSLPLAAGQTLFWHPNIAGFGVRVGAKKRVYVAQAQVEVSGRKRDRRMTIGDAEVWSLPDAEARARELIVSMQAGDDPKVKKEILTLEGVLGRVRQIKGDGYAKNIEQYLPDLVARPVADITPNIVEAEYRRIISEVAARKHGPSATSTQPGVATANSVMRGLSASWNLYRALDRSSIPENPVPALTKVRALKKTPVKSDIIPEDQVGEFLKLLAEDDWDVGRDLIFFMLLTGIRRGQACGMRVQSWDGTKAVMKFSAAVTKSKRDTELPVSQEIAMLLDRRTRNSPNGFMFPSTGEHGHVVEPKSILKRLAKGYPLSVHGIRRTFGSQAMFAMGEVQRKMLMDHSLASGGVTQAHYSVTDAESLRPSAQAVTDRILDFSDDRRAITETIAYGSEKDGFKDGERRADRKYDTLFDSKIRHYEKSQEELRRIEEELGTEEFLRQLKDGQSVRVMFGKEYPPNTKPIE